MKRKHKTAKVAVCMTPTQKAKLAAHAQQLGLSTSTWLLTLGLKAVGEVG